MARIEWTEGAVRDLEKLDRQIVRRILRKLDWFSRNFARVVPEPLAGEFKGTYKLRVGDWRIIYTWSQRRDLQAAMSGKDNWPKVVIIVLNWNGWQDIGYKVGRGI